ncbi:MAG: PD-(D/E)XK nuclease family protein, partial [Acutalibacteraceae bacterium]
AKSRAVKIAEPIILNQSRYNSKALLALERLLAGGEFERETGESAITVCRAQTVYDEAEFAARTIRRLVRTENYRYRDFVIIARDSEKYQPAVEIACRRNNINCFYDNKIPLSAFPLSVAAKAAIQALNFSTENILAFHKTGLGTLNPEEIPLIENYAFVWNITGELWLKEWDMDPRGMTTDDDPDGKYTEELQEINRLREIAIAPIVNFKENFTGNAKKMAAAIVNLFISCGFSEKLSQMCREFKTANDGFYADAIKLSFDEYMKVLDSLVVCFGEAPISKQEFADALELAVALGSVGVIPQTLDEVTFGAADRIRPSRPKIAFILGANQGEFPKTISNSGVFALSERKKLIENGINISDNAVISSIDEDYLVYSNLCCASDKLFISYSEKTVAGEALEPSAFVSEIMEEKNHEFTEFPATGNLLNIAPETALATFGDYCRLLKTSPVEAESLKRALEGTEFIKRAEIISQGEVKKNEKLSPATAERLYGKNIYMSASRLDNFNHCHFSYFCKFGLKIEKLRAADFNVMQRGTIVHYVLERIIGRHKKQIADLEYSVLDELTDRYIAEYLDNVKGFSSVKDAKTEFLISRISRSLKEVVRNISDEMKQTDFEPVACELKIRDGGDIPAMRFPIDDGTIMLTGSIDRVDEYNGYIRIIDYKTGSKEFKLPDILFGLNLQMLLYLYAVTRGRGLPDHAAAGILYKPATRDVKDEGMAMNGLIAANEELVRAMDKEGNGQFVPKFKLNKDGSISKNNSSFIEPENFTAIFDYIEKLMKNTGKTIRSGDIAVAPLDGRETPACKYCDYGIVCGIEDCDIPKVEALTNSKVLEIIKGDENNAD